MMKYICFVFCVFAIQVSLAASNSCMLQDQDGRVKLGNKFVSRHEIQQMLQRANYKKTGGSVRKDGTANGYCVLLNSQDLVAEFDINKALEVIDRQVHIQIKTVYKKGVDFHNAKAEIHNAGGEVGVLIVDDAFLPALLCAPEEGWSVVNVAKLQGDVNNSVLAARARREILRAFGMAVGLMYAAQGDYVLQPITKPNELDNIKREEFGAMMQHIFPLSLPYYNVRPWYQRTYEKACQEGWAPAPTNDVQKAIWDKIHTMPTEPIKIKPETKKQDR